MNVKAATWAAVISGFSLGMIAVLLQCRGRAADGRDILTLAIAVAIPVMFVRAAGGTNAT